MVCCAGFLPVRVAQCNASTGISYGCVSVCVCVICRHCVKTAELIQVIFGTQISLVLSYVVLKGNLGMSKSKASMPNLNTCMHT